MPEDKTLPNHRVELENRIFSAVREVPDFPKPGILFKDINPLLREHVLCKDIIDHLADYYSNNKPDCIASIESRGFYFGFPLAMKLGIPFVPIRKKGKLPGDVHQIEYQLEYGTAIIELQKEVIKPNSKVLIHDDVLATGGTALAAAELVKACGAEVHSFNFIIELSFLNGQEKLNEVNKNTYNLAIS
jgi:adenine phosphoribosyltransferase